MTKSELFYTLALLQVEGVGDIVAKKLINHCGSAEKVFQAKKSKLVSIDGIGEVLIKKLANETIFKLADAEIKFIEAEKQVDFFRQDNEVDILGAYQYVIV